MENSNSDIILPFERKLNTHSEAELLALYLTGKLDIIKLSDKMQEKLTRLEVCRDLYFKLKSRAKVIKEMLMITWHNASGEAYKLSKPQVYRDFDDAIELFNITTNVAGLNFHLDILLKNINETREKAIQDRDWKTAAVCDKNYATAIEKFLGDTGAEEYRKLQPGIITTDFLPEESKVKLPKDWEQQVKRLIKKKREFEMTIEDAEIIEEHNDERDSGNEEDSP